MSFCRFKGIWTIKTVDLLSSEIVDHRIAIGGRKGNVLILCVDDARHVHPACSYDQLNDRIVGPTFEINWAPGPPRLLTCSPLTPGNTGSWTAEDPGGMGGDGDDGDDGDDEEGNGK